MAAQPGQDRQACRVEKGPVQDGGERQSLAEGAGLGPMYLPHDSLPIQVSAGVIDQRCGGDFRAFEGHRHPVAGEGTDHSESITYGAE